MPPRVAGWARGVFPSCWSAKGGGSGSSSGGSSRGSSDTTASGSPQSLRQPILALVGAGRLVPPLALLAGLLEVAPVVGRHGHQNFPSDLPGPTPAVVIIVDGGVDGVDDLVHGEIAEMGEGAGQWMAGLLAEVLDEGTATPDLEAVGGVAAHFESQMTAAAAAPRPALGPRAGASMGVQLGFRRRRLAKRDYLQRTGPHAFDLLVDIVRPAAKAAKVSSSRLTAGIVTRGLPIVTRRWAVGQRDGFTAAS